MVRFGHIVIRKRICYSFQIIHEVNLFKLTMQRLQYGPLARYVKLRVAHAPGMLGTFSPPPWVSDPDMHHGTCVTHVP